MTESAFKTLNFTFEEFVSLKTRLFEGNPIVRRFGLSPIVADPSVLTPEESPDGKWHLFCHTLFGVVRFEGTDPFSFGFKSKIVPRAMRPNVNKTADGYALLYERTQPLIPKAITLLGGKWHSEIYASTSRDLIKWSRPFKVLGHTRSYESDERGTALSNPYLLWAEGKYRLYYSAGQTYIDDCGFTEPTHISYAESRLPLSEYEAAEKPLISPDADSELFNLCSGCIKVYRLKDCYIGLQNGIYSEQGVSKSAIQLLRSDDGLNFSFAKTILSPTSCPGTEFMAGYVYASDLVESDGKLYLYFNARDKSSLRGTENIGVLLFD